jgi:ABC-2 type transport system permease protein
MSIRNILIIFKREIKTFFTSPIAYFVLTIFLLLTGWFFFSTFFLAGRADMRDFFNLLPIVFSFVIPAITMRMFAEEYRSGSFEITATLPVNLMDIIAGKFLGALFFTIIMLLPTLIYPIFIGFLGELDAGPVIGGYLGALFLAGAYSAIGIFGSSLTRNQIIAFMISAGISFFLTIISGIILFLPSVLTGFLQYLGAVSHFNNIAKGIIDSRDLVYFLSVIVLCMSGTFLVIKEKNKSIKLNFPLYFVALILVNIVSGTLFLRLDITSNKKYSLSEVSKKAVNIIEEPLTIKAFFSENLPGAYSNLQRELNDLMDEYSLAGNKNFNFQIFTINSDGTSKDKFGKNLKELAESYSIHPIQIQTIESDEVKLQSVYMGMVLVHGNMMETIPSIAAINNLEYEITGTINKISRKISSLISLEENIILELYLSSSLYAMGDGLSSYPDKLGQIVNSLNSTNYNRLTYRHIDPDTSPLIADSNLKLTSFNLQTSDGSTKNVYADLLIRNGDKSSVLTLLRKNIFGYDMINPDELSISIEGVVEKLLGLNEEIAYLSAYGTPSLFQNPYDQTNKGPGLNNFNRMISDNYSLIPLDDLTKGIPENIKTLIIAGPKEAITEWDLYQIDQFIMKGNSVAFFIDTHSEVYSENQNPNNPQPPVYIPRNTGLENLIKHYGIEISNSYILDENSYKQVGQDRNGSLSETTFYFAPEILSKNINRSLPFLKNIKGLIMLNVSPLVVDQNKKKESDIDVLFSSSDKSWEMTVNINLYNPMTIFPPQNEEKRSYPLSAIIDGKIQSYFFGKKIPERPLKEGAALINSVSITGKESFLSESNTGKIFVIGTSAVLMDNVLDQTGTSPNSVFIYNIFDKLNDRTDFAEMRSKGQSYNPIRETTPGERSFIKGFTVVGLPLLSIVSGIMMWLFWRSRKKRIALLFKKEV